MTPATCLAYQPDGSLCRQPATILDPERGGLVCWRHDPAREDRFTWTEDDAEGLTLTLPDGTIIDLAADEAPEEEG
jgi:hypothetical protein